jgi:predicted nucleic acid-binding protein
MATQLLIDTDVIIDYLRGRKEAANYLESLKETLLLSCITVAELYAGVREGEERLKLKEFLQAFEIIPIDEEISVTGGLYRRDYGKSHGTGLADAIVAATVELRKATLVTLNKKHFPMVTHIKIPYHKS